MSDDLKTFPSQPLPTCAAQSPTGEACELAPHPKSRAHQAGRIGGRGVLETATWFDPQRWAFALLCATCGMPLHGLPFFEATPEQLGRLAQGIPIERCGCLGGRPLGALTGSFVEVDATGQLLKRVELAPKASGLVLA